MQATFCGNVRVIIVAVLSSDVSVMGTKMGSSFANLFAELVEDFKKKQINVHFALYIH